MTMYIVHEFAGSVEVWPAMTGGRLTSVAFFAGFTVQLDFAVEVCA
jgi:hypothetical protein